MTHETQCIRHTDERPVIACTVPLSATGQKGYMPLHLSLDSGPQRSPGWDNGVPFTLKGKPNRELEQPEKFTHSAVSRGSRGTIAATCSHAVWSSA